MKTITEINLEIVENTRQRFFKEVGRKAEDERKMFINWYIENHKGSFDMLINDLSHHYLFISESRIIRILNEKE